MPLIPPLRAREVVRALQRLGFRRVRQRGSHLTMRSDDGRTAVVIDHGSRDLPPRTTHRMLKEAQVPIPDFLDAL